MAIQWLESTDRPTYDGAVLEYPVWHSNIGGGDYESKFARVWTGTAVADIDVGTVSYGSSWPLAHVGVDATPEVKALAAAWQAEQKRLQYHKASVIQAWKHATGLHKGNTVVVRYGRKIPKGTIAVIDATSNTYGPSVLLRGFGWTKGDNVHVLVDAIPAELQVKGADCSMTDAQIWQGHAFEVKA